MEPVLTRAKLDASIRFVAANREKYVAAASAFTRQRKLGMADTISTLLAMQGGSLKKELYTAGVDVTASAFVQSRKKILPGGFEALFRNFNRLCHDSKTFRKYHIFAVDGSCVNMPRNANAPSFVRNDGNPRGYNQMHLNALFDLENKTYADAVIQPQPRADEIGALITMLRRQDFRKKSLIVCDRGYESYNLFAHFLNTSNVDFLCRVKQDRSAMREVAKLPMEELDVDVSFTITTTQTNEDKEKNYIFVQARKTHARKLTKSGRYKRYPRWDFPSPYPMRLRIVRFMLDNGEYETVATSLPRRFTAADIKELYHRRWGIETSFRELKYAIGLINLHGKSDDFVRQEIFAALTMYNLSSRISSAVVVEQKQETVYAYRVNFTMAIFLCREYFRDRREDGDVHIQAISRYIEPVRPGRMDKRKLRPKGFVGFIYRIAA